MSAMNLVDERSHLIEDRARVVLLNQFVEFNVAEVLVEVHRKLGDAYLSTMSSRTCSVTSDKATSEFRTRNSQCSQCWREMASG